MRYSFAAHLAKYGPSQARHQLPISLGRAQRYCDHFLRSHAENFTVSSLLLPRRLWKPFAAIYAYCRWADDLGDETGGGANSLQLLRWWRRELLDCYEGYAWHPVMIALQPVIREYQIPPQPFLDLLYAFEQDQLVTQYSTYDRLLEYCRYSANPVGHLILYLFRSFDPESAALSDSICTGLQLANFWQDVARDKAIGRIYLPEEDRQRFGYSEQDFREKRYNRAFVSLMRYQVERARELLYRGMPLVGRVPRDCAIEVDLFMRGGLAILKQIERIYYNVWAMRPEVSAFSKGWMLLGAVARRWSGRGFGG
ncbi:squalene synthase HpnC [Tuwongella immobilis]|nr:squalene synthase HpnC [Tuwongella immobilis]